jgi:hypothetical protein
MAAAEKGDAWLERQRWREERMRFEVLALLYEACGKETDCIVRVSDFAAGLGVWREELFRTVEYLERRGYLHYHGGGPSVSITQQGIDYIESEARRRSIRD